MRARVRLVLAALSLAAGFSAAAELEPVPRPDLSAMEEAIGLQLDGSWRLVEEATGRGQAARAEAYGTLGQLYHLYGMDRSAAACYRNARLLAPEDLQWPYYLALLYSRAGEVERAAARLEEVLALAPDHLPSLIRMGELHLDANRPADAAAFFRRALDVDGAAAAGHYGAGKAAAVRGDHAAAVGHFEWTLELQGEASIVHYPLALSLRRLGKVERARVHLEQRGVREVAVPDPLAARLADLSTLAAFRLVRALAAKEEGFSAAELLGTTLSLLARVSGAVEQLEQVLAGWPEERLGADAAQRARLHYAAGALRVHRGQDDQAVRHFRAAIALAPDLLDARVKLANVLARRRAYPEAVAQLSIALERDPGLSEARIKRAASLLAIGRPREAARDLERLEISQPHNPEVRFRFAVALEQLGRQRQAVDRYLAAARLETSVAQQALAHYRAARLLRALADPRAARSHYRRALELQPSLAAAAHELAELGLE